MATEITKPSAPMTRSPIAETFEIVLNSWTVGFFRRRQTLRYLWYWLASVLVSLLMVVCGSLGF